MNKGLQKLILRIIKENNGVTTWKIIASKSKSNYYRDGDVPREADTVIKHQLDLLQKEDKVIREDQLPEIYYILTPRGHQEFDCWLAKAKRFILYDKHNLFVLLSFLIALCSLVISFFCIV